MMRFGICFLLLGAVCLAAGVGSVLSGGGFAWLVLVWPAVSFFTISAAYLGMGAGVFCKRLDGSLPALIVIALLPYFLMTWGIWRMLRLGKEPCWDRLAPGIYLGGRPLAGEIPADVRLVVDVTAEFSRPKGMRADQAYRCLPMLDGSVPEESACRALVDDLSQTADPIYVHCAQGHGRSAMVAGALLVRKGLALDAQDAEAQLKAARPRVSLSADQRQLLARLTTERSQPLTCPPGQHAVR
jgi:protein-tyrosine phosphatase